MSRLTPIDRFTLPKDIPDHLPGDFPGSVPGEIPSPTDASWRTASGGDAEASPQRPLQPLAHAQAEEAARGYVMRSAAGRGWSSEEPHDQIVMVQGLPCTAEDLRLMAEGEIRHQEKAAAGHSGPLRVQQAKGERNLEAGNQSHVRPGPAPLLTPRRQAEFCSALAGHGNVRLACRAVQVSPQTAYRARRASWQFRQCWDAALVLARDHAEQVLADRALNGVEEKVFYHGEEVATRTRYSDRLLLAHLARLDRKAEERATCEDCDAPLLDDAHFDAAVEALATGADGAPHFAPGQCSMCSTLAAEEAAQAAQAAEARVAARERRLAAMHAALPPGAREESGMSDSEWQWAEPERLAAYEACEENWWLAPGEPAD